MTKPCLVSKGFVLHARSYGETSVLLELITENYGRVGAVAKGVKRRGKGHSHFGLFRQYLFRWVGRNELVTLVDSDEIERYPLEGEQSLCGLYLNELITRLLPRAYPEQGVYSLYAHYLPQLACAADPEPALRGFELELLRHLGYGLPLQHDAHGSPIDPERQYVYKPDHGLVVVTSTPMSGAVSGRTLVAIRERRFTDPVVRREAKQLLSHIIDHHTDGRILKSREIMRFLRAYQTPSESRLQRQ